MNEQPTIWQALRKSIRQGFIVCLSFIGILCIMAFMGWAMS